MSRYVRGEHTPAEPPNGSAGSFCLIYLSQLDAAHKQPKAKCPFVPQREMVKKLWDTDADPLANKSDWERQLEKASRHHHRKA